MSGAPVPGGEEPAPFVVIGEALVDLVGKRGGRTFVAHPGGSPANVALGLARLGNVVTLVTRLGRDAFGEMVSAHLTANGVRVDPGPGDDARTSLAVATLADGRASYDFRIEWDLTQPAPLPATTLCVHTGSLATALAPGNAGVLALLHDEHQRGRVTISYDPNVRPALLGSPVDARPGVECLVGLSDVVKVSDEDLEWLYPGRDQRDVALEWLSTGPALVVVTRGGAGVLAVTRHQVVALPAVPIDLVDTVGAGDSFTAGLLIGLSRADLLGGSRRDVLATMTEATLTGVLELAGRVAAITCARPGADPPTLAEIDDSSMQSTGHSA